MEFRIDRGGFSPLGEVGRYSSSRTQKVSGASGRASIRSSFQGSRRHAGAGAPADRADLSTDPTRPPVTR